MLWWLSDPTHQPIALWYDVRMDGVPDNHPIDQLQQITDNPNMLRMWWHQTAKRCDAIAEWPDAYQVIELRHDSNPQTLGELQMYNALARAEWPTLPWRTPQLVTAKIDAALRSAIEAAGFPITSPVDRAADTA